jgi:L-ascorbate metabolism protein UlaG (beta-lactamase superfamily)
VKRLFAAAVCLVFTLLCACAAAESAPSASPVPGAATLLYQGHASLRITTAEGETIYVDPYAGKGYDVPADLILITHMHPDHDKVSLVKQKSDDFQTITNKEALVGGVYQTFDLGYVKIEAVQAGNNPNHDITVCVGYILTFSNGKTVYISGDTSKTDQMAELAARNLDYAFFCCDGKYNMDAQEAAECAKLVNAKHSIPYHTQVGKLFNKKIAEKFNADNRLILQPGDTLTIE